MTTMLNPVVRTGETRIPAQAFGAEPRLLAELDQVSVADHRRRAGALPSYSREALLAMLDAVSLTGRGGAGFPLAAKIRSLRDGLEPIVVINGAEGEPVSAKDHVLLSRNPQLVFDGAQVLAEAIGARRILIAITDEALVAPLSPAARPGFELHRVPDRFVAGEARALISALNGGSGRPPGRRVLPTQSGVNGRPTLLSNAETFAQLAVLARLGPARFAALGTAAEPGTTLLTVTGAVARPGVVEVPLGTSVSELAAFVGAGPSQAVVTGGFHGSWLPPTEFALSRQGVSRLGGTFGAGVVIFVGTQTCALAELARVAGWLAGESAQQCGPCRFGLPALVDQLTGLVHGAPAAGELRRQAGLVSGRGACAHPDGAVRFIRSALAVLDHELAAHRRGGCGRTDLGHLATDRRRAFTPRRAA